MFIETFGCAMNVRDSENIIAELSDKEDYESTLDPVEADLILINTCSVREKPVQKLFSEIGRYTKLKKEDAKIGVCGCTASHMGEEIFRRAPQVSFVLGARNVSKITEVIHKDKAVETRIDYDESTYMFSSNRQNPYKALINISIGCDKKCAYCIVPKTRGEEVSIPSGIILGEIQKAVDTGAREVLLLGQNVNSYGRRFSRIEEKITFTGLLQKVSAIEGLERIRFTSPHPLHMDDAFITEFATNPKICKSIHMPLQSGSTDVLKRMRRGYSKEWFLDRAAKIREMAPGSTIGTDIIVGFPGESEKDFAETLEVVWKVGFEQIFSFKYSARPHTEAADFTDTVSGDVAGKRLIILQDMHKKMLESMAKKEIGQIHKVLFEGRDKEGNLEGRSDHNKLIRVQADESHLGSIRDVEIKRAGRMALFGEIVPLK